jgi:hypothetical protein
MDFMITRLRLCSAAAVACMTLVATAGAADKTVVSKADDLPRHTYHIDGTASAAVQDEAAILSLAAAVRADYEADLSAYEIPDRTTLKGYYQTLRTIAFLEGRMEDARGYGDTIRTLEDKEAARLTDGMVLRSLAASGGDPDAFERELERQVNELPYDVVQDQLKQSKGMMEIVSANLVVGQIQATVDPMVAATDGELSKDAAAGLIGSHFALTRVLPIKDRIAAVYSRYLDAHAVTKADIWAAREAAVPADAPGHPVVAIWDSGVDTAIFDGLGEMWTNPAEIPDNGIDDDDNGYVDDVHGIAYDLDNNPVPELLLPLPDLTMGRAELQRLVKGLEDLQSNIDSPEASELKGRIGALGRDEVKPFLEEVSAYANLSHGTHVAGIAAAGNPNIRLLASRLTFDHRMVPPPPTIAEAYRSAAAATENVDYFKAAGVQVVNMSWGGSISGVEAGLEMHGIGATPEERKQLARKIFDIGFNSLRDAMASAPEILFVVAAGNSDSDNEFEEFLPSSIELPNVLTVGAVDQAGEETGFTSFGKVDVYANGFEVESYVPGGDRLKYSGTSMSSPNVVNLAAKLLAVDPDLTVAELRGLIEDGCDEAQAGTRTVRLINPRQSMELLGKRRTES